MLSTTTIKVWGRVEGISVSGNHQWGAQPENESLACQSLFSVCSNQPWLFMVHYQAPGQELSLKVEILSVTYV